MGNYGEAARIAVGLMARDESLAPREAWNRAVASVFPDSPSSRAKGCPRDSFLTLCEIGAVQGVPPGAYTRSLKNKAYVTRALEALRRTPELSGDKGRLWKLATEGAGTRPNGQMDVLTALWREGHISPD